MLVSAHSSDHLLVKIRPIASIGEST